MKVIYLAAILAVAVIAGCTDNVRVNPNYQAYLEGSTKQAQLESSKVDSVALAANACAGDARCVENVTAMAAMAAVAASNGARTNSLQPFVEQPSFWRQAGLALIGQIAPLASAAVNWHQADTQARVSIAQFHYMDDVLTASTTALGHAQPNITVGGNYGDTHTGDTIGGDQTTIGRDFIPGTQINNTGNYGDHNRQDSPGPIGPACTGDTCQGTSNPPPATGG